MRIFYILWLVTKYLILYSSIRFGITKQPTPKLLRNFFEDAGGTFIKFGQILSLRVDVLPKEYAQEMLQLFDNVKPFSYAFVEEIFIQELGAKPEKLFIDFQKKPFASASFGQVHAAKLKGNHIVAVKIQRPSIEQQVLADFLLIDVLAFIGDMFFKVDALPWREFASEFKKWTKEELDYHKETDHLERMQKNAAKRKDVVIPQVYPYLSTKRILVQDYIEGIPLSRVMQGLKDGRLTKEKLLKMGINGKKIAKLLTSEILREFFIDGFFHADPHPGNILILKNDKLAFIDFGIVGQSMTYNKKSFVEAIKGYADMDFKRAVYNSTDFMGEELKCIIASALPANVSQKSVVEFTKFLANHFSETVENIVIGNVKNLEVMKTDYTVVAFQIMKAAKRYKIKMPKEMVLLIRTLSIVGFLAKELDYGYRLTEETKAFFHNYPENEWLKDSDNATPYKRISYESAIEKLNDWLSYLVEIDPPLYQLVQEHMKKYTSPTH